MNIHKVISMKKFRHYENILRRLQEEKNVDLTLFNIFAFDLTDIHVTKLSHQFERRAKVQNLYTKRTHSFPDRVVFVCERQKVCRMSHV